MGIEDLEDWDDDLVKQRTPVLDELCVWYQNQSITEVSPMYIRCRVMCNGYNKGCHCYMSNEREE